MRPEQPLEAALRGRYELERQIGQGGMATVFLARDLRHGRHVALKVLTPDLGVALGPERFLREIALTASLRHPHILPLYDSGAENGVLFYVMPFVEGETLRGRLTREGRLSVDESIRLTLEISDALHHAHMRGIVHRDIKPENILLENGHAVVADFGIAHVGASAGSDRLTSVGLSLGTPAYMSPEQCTGEDVDARSDLYALGCLLYEMIAGTPPFTGRNAMAVIARHMMDPVPPLGAIRTDVAEHVVRNIEHALAKSPEDRPASVAGWAAGFRPESNAALPHAAPVPTASARMCRRPPPPPVTRMLGRDASVEEAIERVGSGARVLTITGVGGSGKTRFAVELFQRTEMRYEGGAAFVSLASVTDVKDVFPAIAAALDIADAPGRTALESVATLIASRRFLLVLDNLEQVIDAAEEIADLVAKCPQLQIVATSRRPLKIGAEVELALPPLDVPGAGVSEVDELIACPSVALFVSRAEKVKPGFALSPGNAVSVAAICRALDGLPLALELAAARVRILEPAVLLQRLDHALDLLTSGDRDLPLRQRTLRATISWSYSLLSPAEQRALRHLSTFHEGWTLEGMERVCYTPEECWRALDELESLAEKGLVRVIADGDRYSLLETIRAFAAEQLHATGEVTAAKDAHAAYFTEFAQDVDRGIKTGAQLRAMTRARAENANLFAALDWLVARTRRGEADARAKGMRLCGWLGWYWHIAGLHLAASHAVTSLLEDVMEGPPSVERGLACFTAGMIGASTNDFEGAIRYWTRMTTDGDALGDAEVACFGHLGLGYVSLGGGDVDAAVTYLDQAIAAGALGASEFLVAGAHSIRGMALFVRGDVEKGRAEVEAAYSNQARRQDFEFGGMSLSFLASMTFAASDIAGALALYVDAEAAFATVGDKPELARVQCEMGYAALVGGEPEAALRHFRRALRTYDENGSPPGVGQALIGLAAAEAMLGRTAHAIQLAAAAQSLATEAGVVLAHPMAPGVAEQIAAIRASIPRAELEAMQLAASSLTPREILAMAGY